MIEAGPPRARQKPVKLHPEAEAAVEKLLGDLDSEVKRARKE